MSGRGLSITNTYVVDGMNSVKREEERNGEADPDARSNKQGRREGKGEKALVILFNPQPSNRIRTAPLQ